MTDFDYDVLQKKRIASGAYHRKGGSKSKKCTLPSDHLTEAQKRKLNGPVTTVNLNQPIRWQEFKALNSDSLKKSYLTNLLNTYKPTANMIGEMMGVAGITVRKEMRRLGLPVGAKGGDQNSPEAKAKKAMWAAFCNGVVGGGNSIISGANEQIEAQDEQIESEPVQTETQAWDLDSPDHVNACRVTPDEEPQVTCYDPEAEVVARSQEWMRELLTRGVPLRSDEEKIAESEAEGSESAEAEPRVTKGPKRLNLTSLDARYRDEADAVLTQIGSLMALFGSAPIKARLTIEVCE